MNAVEKYRASIGNSRMSIGSAVDRYRASINTNMNTDPEYAETLEAAGFTMFPEEPAAFGTSMEPQSRRERGRERAARTTIKKGMREFKRAGRLE